jgi:hypothetical protein
VHVLPYGMYLWCSQHYSGLPLLNSLPTDCIVTYGTVAASPRVFAPYPLALVCQPARSSCSISGAKTMDSPMGDRFTSKRKQGVD